MAESSLSPVASESVATGAIMPLVSLKKHYKISIGIFVTLVVLGIPIAWFKGKAYYLATAVVYVSPHFANILQDSKEQEISQYQQFLTQQTGTVGRYDILLSALQKLGDKRFVWQNKEESDRHAAERLQAALVIAAVKDTYLFSVSLESDKKEYLDEIINTIVSTYLEESQKDQILYAAKERLSVLYEQREKLQQIIIEKKKRVQEISKELSITTFVDSSTNPYDALLADSQRAYSDAQRDRMTAEAGLLLFENPKDPGASSSALESIVSDIVYKDQGLHSLKANMYQQRSRLVEQISGLDPRHPLHEQIKKQLAVIEAEVVSATEQLSQVVTRMLLEERRSKVALTTKIEQDLANQINEQKKHSAWFSTNYNEALTLNQDIKRFYTQLETVENRISFIELESKAPGFIRVESFARPPEQPVRGGRKKIVIIFFVLGGILGLIVPIIIDILDKRIKTAGQVEKLIGYKPLAALLENDPEVSPNIIADQKRRLALALVRERKRSGKQSNLILLTAVNHESAVTSLAFDLAMDYQKIGMRSVVVEVNALKPDKRYITEAINNGIMNMILDPDITIDQVVSTANDKYPDRISIGMPDGGLLFGYHHLEAVLAKIAEDYAIVILDTAPILFSADVEFLVSISDITLLVIAAQSSPPQIKRTVQLLERIDPKVIGFVVTRLQLFKGGGYYSKVYAKTSTTQSADIATSQPKLRRTMTMKPTRLLYLLHSGNLYGTERMALVTLDGFRKELQPLLFAPPGPVHQAAKDLGIESQVFNGASDLLKQLPQFLSNSQKIAVCATGVSHSLIFLMLNLRFHLKNVHLHLVHGGTDERLSYGRKKLLNYLPIKIIAVSNYVAERLLANGVRNQQIKVLENFLPDQQIESAKQRSEFTQVGIKKVIVVSRVDPIKRIDVLLDALNLEPSFQSLEIRILGTGWDYERLREQAQKQYPNVNFVGFSENVAEELAASDLLIHLCPVEPFGLAILEAMAAKIPVLLPNQGGAAGLIPQLSLNDNALAGLHFKANDPNDLAIQLKYLQSASADQLNLIVNNAHQRLWSHYSSKARLNDYRELFNQVINL